MYNVRQTGKSDDAIVILLDIYVFFVYIYVSIFCK